MARKKSSDQRSLNLVPDWAVPGLLRLGITKKPIKEETGYTHNTAKRYLDTHFDVGATRALIQAHEGNVGLCPPHGLIIIDCDNQAAVDLIGPLVDQECPRQERKPGKQHFYIRVDPARHPFYSRNGINLDGALLDVKTWGNVDEELPGGGYAVIPPSDHADGAPYLWAKTLPSSLEEIPMISEELVEILSPFFTRGARARNPRAEGAESRHDKILSYCARAVRYESRADPDASIARVIERGTAYAEELYAGEEARLADELNSLERNVQSAWDQWGGAAALDEQNLDKSVAGVCSSSFGDPWIFTPDLGSWFEWSGEAWVRNHQLMVEQVVSRFPDVLLEDALRERDTERKKRITAMALSLSNSKKVGSVVQALKRGFAVPASALDRDTRFITFPAGLGRPAVTLNTETGEIMEPDPTHFITQLAGAPYVPGCVDDVVEDWWETSFPDPDTRRSVEELAGISLCGSSRQERIIALFGRQGSGKGTLGFSLLSILGDYGHVSGSSLISGNGEVDGSRKDFSMQYLRGKRIVYVDEFSGMLGEKSKTLSQSGTLHAYVKNEDDITFKMTHTIWLSTNRRPKINDPQGFTRRLIEVPMNGGALDIYNLNPSIKNKLIHDEHAKAAMMWRVIQGLDRARANEFSPNLSKEILEASREWLQEANKIGDWIANGCEVTGRPGDCLENAFSEYISWMDEQHMDRRDYPRASKQEFGALMVSMGFEKKVTKTGAGYLGITTKLEEGARAGKISKLHGFKRK